MMRIIKYLSVLVFIAFCGHDCSAKITLKTLLKAVEHHNEWVTIICDTKKFKLSSSDFFNINQRRDTVFVLIEPVKLGKTASKYKFLRPRFYHKFTCSIWSRTDSVFITYSNNSSNGMTIDIETSEIREKRRKDEIDRNKIEKTDNFPKDYGYIPGLLRPEFYERELLYEWDLDSLDNLASYGESLTLTYDMVDITMIVRYIDSLLQMNILL
ncbi:MAG: hypothetical protein K2L14_00555 [Duncaniella sp.]|nr:hypothetical protein [Duncaniella sp.]